MTTDNLTAVEAINRSKLAAWSQGREDPQRVAAANACRRIGESLAHEVTELNDWLRRQRIDLAINSPEGSRQRHTLEATATSHDAAVTAADALGDIGFERWESWTGGAAQSFRRTARELTVARSGDASLVLRIAWGDTPRSGLAQRLFRPSAGDWAMINLPTPLWWAYSLVRPVRHLLERLGRRDPHEASLGPFLLTPRSLYRPLFDLVDLRPHDVLLDIGCGDGQLVQAAAEHTGCQAIGIEHDRALVERGQARLRQHGDVPVRDLVELRHGDARNADLSEVTVAFMFLPMPTASSLLASTLAQLPPDARLLMHEQTPLPDSVLPRPDSSTAVVGTDAVTVAHIWRS